MEGLKIWGKLKRLLKEQVLLFYLSKSGQRFPPPILILLWFLQFWNSGNGSIDFNVCRCTYIIWQVFFFQNYLRHEVAPYNAFLRTVKCCKIKNRFQLTFGISIKSWFEWIFDDKSVRCDLMEFSEFRERLKKFEFSRN